MADTENMTEIKRHLTGEGEMDYDYANDILFFKVKDREYDRSLEFENLVVDIDSENYIVGLQIFDASQFLKMDKVSLREIPSWKFQAYIDEDKVEIRITFQASVRNQLVEKNPIIIQKNDRSLPSSEMVVAV
jgi:uncharacterized protein YuzE